MNFLKLAAALGVFTLTNIASGIAEDELAVTNKAAFLAFDGNQDGTASAKEIVDGLFLLFAASDANSDGSVSVEEFKEISLGYAELAEAKGKLDNYNGAREAIYKRWDVNSDSKLEEKELVGGAMLEVLDSANFSVSQNSFFATKFVTEMADALK
jgi:EF hand